MFANELQCHDFFCLVLLKIVPVQPIEAKETVTLPVLCEHFAKKDLLLDELPLVIYYYDLHNLESKLM